MKKLLTFIVIALPFLASAQKFQSHSFLSDIVATNGVNGRYAGITVSNAASGSLGGYTNVLSWLSAPNNSLIGTNSLNLTYTNFNGIWVIVTNGVPATVTGISFVTNDATVLTRDVPLWTLSNGGALLTAISNNAIGEFSYISPVTLSLRMSGAASAGTALNLLFVGLPDGVNEPTGAAAATAPFFQWGVVPAAGIVVTSTNFPAARFAGCKAIRLRSATLTTSTAANIQVTIQALNLNGFVP